MSRRTDFTKGSQRAVESGVALGELKRIFEAWAREEAEANDVMDALARYVDTLK